ncbi:MAG: hypothetical protein RBS16_07675, partial [Candidatus Cloacimonadales bacterium]|nr:hypothetical protein [Candidatus Cloacimonadales bacterium]
NTRLYSQYKKLIYIAKSIVNNLYTEGDTESVFHLKKTRESLNWFYSKKGDLHELKQLSVKRNNGF